MGCIRPANSISSWMAHLREMHCSMSGRAPNRSGAMWRSHRPAIFSMSTLKSARFISAPRRRHASACRVSLSTRTPSKSKMTALKRERLTIGELAQDVGRLVGELFERAALGAEAVVEEMRGFDFVAAFVVGGV